MLKQRGISLKTLTLLLVLTIALPLLAVIVFFNIYTVQRSNLRVYESGLNTIDLYQNALESDLRGIESSMLSLIAADPYYRQMRYQLETYPLFSNIYSVQKRYQDFMFTYPIIGIMRFYSQANSTGRTEFRDGYDYAFKKQLETVIDGLLKSPKNPTQLGWFYQTVQGRAVLVRILGKDGLFTVCVVDPQEMAVPQTLNSGNEGVLIYATEQGEPAINQDFIKTNDILLDPTAESFYLTGSPKRYLVSAGESGYGGTRLFYLQPYGGILGNLDMIQNVLLIISVLLCLLIPFAVTALNRQNFRPMELLIHTMEQIRSGQTSAKMRENYEVREFLALSTTFNELMEEIHRLKIESYEKEIGEQKAHLLLLQSQIRPHFYLNCLKNVQALAQERQYDNIQSLVVELSAYLRYLFQAPSSMVALEDELRSVSSYINLQRLITSRPPECVVTVPSSLSGFFIPPLSILTFVENAVKHANLPDRTLIIRIKAVLLESEEGKYLNITITDNGCGFSPEMLSVLNSSVPQLREGHIGIANVLRRFELVYSKRSTFVFSNLREGSCIDVFIPLDAAPAPSRDEREGKKL